jgi:hypothetical protein
MEIALTDWSRTVHGLFFQYRAGDHLFSNSYWYESCDLIGLEERHGAAVMQRIYLHIAAFEMDKLASLDATEIDLGPLAAYVDEAFIDLWTRVIDGVWAQWRYENDLPGWRPPRVVNAPRSQPDPVEAPLGEIAYLAFCGGGKDSAIAQSLLASAGVRHDSFVYASSAYGRPEKQFELIGRLEEQLDPIHIRRLVVVDDMMEAPPDLLCAEAGVRSLTAAETPSSIFSALPLVLQHGYQYLVLGHERSADVGNLIWAATGEDVNHQWGKSTDAERLLSSYLRASLVPNLEFFSILKPIHDVLIFGMLRGLPDEVVRATHSCNVDKPWCRRCAKCVYVWLNYLAYLDHDLVRTMFAGENLFDIEDNFTLLRELIGLGEHTPFECIGEIPESTLALALCRARGLAGRFLGEAPEADADTLRQIIDEYTAVDHDYPSLPEPLGLWPTFDGSATATRRWLLHTLGL